MKQIIAHNIFPPIPVRDFDWCAFYEGDEERQEYGYGATEQEAIADLRKNFDEPQP